MKNLSLIVVGCVALLGESGCGGSGGSSSQSVDYVSSALVSSLRTYVGGNSATLEIVAVDDTGSSFGGSGVVGGPAAYWPEPSDYRTIPYIDSTAKQEFLSGQSADGTQLIGFTWDTNNSLGPGRGFVYTKATARFHLLSISVPNATQLAVHPTAITNSGQVTGTIACELQSGSNETLNFTYNINTDQYQTTPWNYNDNGTYRASANSTNEPEMVSDSSGQVVALDSSDAGWQVSQFSADASTMLLTSPSQSHPQDVKLWKVGTNTVSVNALLVAWGKPNLGSVPTALSPGGHFAVVQSAYLNTNVLIQMK